MRPRYAADYRTFLWMLAMPIVAGAQYLRPSLMPFLSPLSCYLALTAGVIAHNHNHCPTFRNRRANAFFGHWLSMFYGYPTFAWIPTHNLNHHKYVDRAGDATITWRLTRKNTFLMAFIYFFVSSYWQAGPTKEYIAKARAGKPALYRQIVTQYVVVIGAHVGMLALGVALHGWRGVFVYLSALGLPALFALWAIMYTNYIQHVHCDPWSKHNHSRNFVSPTNNFFVFNGGFHTVHHEHPGVHWSKYPALHAQIAHEIHPALNETSIIGYTVKQYILGTFVERYRTKQIGRPAYDAGDGSQDLTTATIGDAAEVGVTAQAV